MSIETAQIPEAVMNKLGNSYVMLPGYGNTQFTVRFQKLGDMGELLFIDKNGQTLWGIRLEITK